MVVCSSCSTSNETGRKFCKECGNALAVPCRNCGSPNTPDAKFCGECGIQLSAAAPTPPSAVPAAPTEERAAHAERRLVSVLFADLVGFTTLAEGRDPEETRDLLSRYFALARDVIDRHGGTVEKFIGDAVMAVWGAPVAREDDAERAVRAALALVDAVKEIGSGIDARAGVLTGEAAVTIGAAGEGMVAGDLVNTASRLQSVAPPGAVLVGETTERAASQAIVFEEAGDQMLRGKVAPLPAYRAVRVVAELGGRNRSTGALEAPFVGRDEEFRLLKDFFHVTGRDRRPRLISVMGPAGIGKSRLAWEFAKYTDGLVEDTYWHTGRSPSYGEGITFWALGEMVRRRAGLLEADDEPTTRRKIAESVETFISDATERRTVEAALLTLLGLSGTQMPGRDELFAAWRTFFERIAEQGTTVLIFEDLQWADSGLLDFIDHLLDWTKSLPIFVMTLARPELLERRPDWGAGRRNFVSLALEPLSEAHMEALLDGLVPGLPRDVKRLIIARADGVPLYAVETVRMLVADGRLEQVDGVYRPVGDLASIAIPETLTALIAARLDALTIHERSVVQAAAVLGQSFSLAALDALTGMSTDQLRPILDGFVRREVFSLDVDPRSPEHGQYTFVQALIREVAYNQLARNERKTRHLAAARWFESLGDDELAGVLAGHYAAAHENAGAGPEAEALAGQARIALRGAAERAAALGSHEQAVAYLLKALPLTSDPGERAALLERAGHEANDRSPDEGAEHFGQAMELYRSVGDLRGLARAATGRSISLMLHFRPVEAVAVVEAALSDTAAIEGEPEWVRLLSELARGYANSANPRALELVDRVIELAERMELMPIIAEAVINRALVLNYSGRYYEPTALLRGVLPFVEAHGLIDAHLRALNNLAVALNYDDIAQSVATLRAASDVARRAGALGPMVAFRNGTMDPLIGLGRWDEADQIVAESHEADIRDPANFDYFQGLALLLALRGDDAAATDIVERLRPALARMTLREMEGFWARIDAYVDAVAGRLDAAQRHASRGVAYSGAGALYAAEWGMRSALWMGDAAAARKILEAASEIKAPGRVLATMRLAMRASVDALEGRHEDAAAGFRQAAERWRTQGVTTQLGFALTDYAAGVPPSVSDAAAAAHEARELWTRLGSPAMLARLDDVLGRWATGAPQQAATRVAAPSG